MEMSAIERKEYHKEYYQNNKERILKQMAEQIVCPHCKKPVSKQHMNRHVNTKYCQAIKEKIFLEVTKNEEMQQLKIRIEAMEKLFPTIDFIHNHN